MNTQKNKQVKRLCIMIIMSLSVNRPDVTGFDASRTVDN